MRIPPLSSGATAADDTRRRNLLPGVLFGIGLAAFVDEAVFHQLLHWHQFYDRSTPDIGLVSDGLLNVLSWFATVSALFLVADLNRRRAFLPGRWWAGLLVGAGGFQLFDGVVNHKVLNVHQIRYVPDIAPYDLVWNLAALVLLLAGVILLRRSTATRAPAANPGAD